jgi:predicted DCC family thiol-disulfide oxidoreductase YuxK
MSHTGASGETQIIYDGECPFCTAYVRLSRLRDSVGPVTLIDARQGGPVVDAVRRAGYDLDQGMVLSYAGRLYHGADCLNMLALLSSRSSVFNRMTSAMFRRPALARVSYPVLRGFRNLTLAALGRRRLNSG